LTPGAIYENAPKTTKFTRPIEYRRFFAIAVTTAGPLSKGAAFLNLLAVSSTALAYVK